MANETPNRLTFEEGDGRRWSGVEQGKSDQSSFVKNIAQYAGKFVAKLLQRPGDLWDNQYVRVLWARYDTGEKDGQEYEYLVSFMFPGGQNFGNNLLWELHHGSELYNLNSLGLAPFAITTQNGRLKFRITTGRGIIGSGWPVWMPNIDLGPIVYDKRTDVAIRLKLSEGSDGAVKVWLNTTGTPDPDMASKTPIVNYAGVTTPSANNGTKMKSLYTEHGIYSGAQSVSQTDTLITFGSLRDLVGKIKAMVQYVGVLGGPTPDPTPDPEPDPDPVPGTPTKVYCSVQQGMEITPGTNTVTVKTLEGEVPGEVDYFIDGKRVATSEDREHDFAATIVIPATTKDFGFICFDEAGQEIPTAYYIRYPIKMKVAPQKLNLQVDPSRSTATFIWVKWTKISGATGYKTYRDEIAGGNAGPNAVDTRFGPVTWAPHTIRIVPQPVGIAPEEAITVAPLWRQV